MAVTYSTPPSGATLDTGHSLYGNLKSLIIVPRGTQTLDDLAAADSVSFSSAPSWGTDGDAGEVPTLSAQYITMPYSSSRLMSASYTIMLGMDISVLDNPWGGLVSINNGDDTNVSLALQRDNANNGWRQYHDSGTSQSLGTSGRNPSDFVSSSYTVITLVYNTGTDTWYLYKDDGGSDGGTWSGDRTSITSGSLGIFCERTRSATAGADGKFYWFAYFDTDIGSTAIASIAADPWQLVTAGGASAEGGGMLLGSRRNRLTIP